jgi:tetratricopeptide (TPR) repeat protein
LTTRAPENQADADLWAAVDDAAELIRDHELEAALTSLRDVLAQNPANYYAYHFLGIALFEARSFQAARDAYLAAVRLAPQYLGARIHLVHVFRSLGQLKEAHSHAETARRQAPNDPEVWHAIGLVHAATGQYDVARKYLHAFLEANPELEVAMEVRSLLRLFPDAAPTE